MTYLSVYFRGEFRTVQKKDIVASAWKDNKMVMVMATNVQATSTGSVQRKQHDGTVIPVTCPESIILYNKFMGGVDRGDQIRGYYRCRVKSRKFYKYIYIFPAGCSHHQLPLSYTKTRRQEWHMKSLKCKQFRLELASQLIGDYCNRCRHGRYTSASKWALLDSGTFQ